MRGTVAKRIRNMARQEAAANPTEYKVKWFFKTILMKDGPKKTKVGTVFCTGFRRIYQDMKQAYKINPVGSSTLNLTR